MRLWIVGVLRSKTKKCCNFLNDQDDDDDDADARSLMLLLFLFLLFSFFEARNFQ